MTRLPQPGSRHLTTGPQRGWLGETQRRAPQGSLHPRHVPGHAAPRAQDALSFPPLLPREPESPRARGTPRPHRGTKGTADSVQRAARSAPTNRYVCLAAPRVSVTRRRGPQFLGAGGPARVLCPPPGSLAAAPTRPAGHVAARHFVWRGRRGCLITRGGRSMRTGGGVGLPGRRPLPAIHTPCSASRASTRCGLRVPARSGARTGAPPSRHVTLRRGPETLHSPGRFSAH